MEPPTHQETSRLLQLAQSSVWLTSTPRTCTYISLQTWNLVFLPIFLSTHSTEPQIHYAHPHFDASQDSNLPHVAMACRFNYSCLLSFVWVLRREFSIILACSRGDLGSACWVLITAVGLHNVQDLIIVPEQFQGDDGFVWSLNFKENLAFSHEAS